MPNIIYLWNIRNYVWKSHGFNINLKTSRAQLVENNIYSTWKVN